jgi:hypothetical protein
MDESDLNMVHTYTRGLPLNWLSWLSCLFGLASLVSDAMPVMAKPMLLAHEVRVSQDVGGTIHIEPNDRPVIGRKTRIWIALTRRGGISIPYEQCDCQMEVRSLTNRQIQVQISPSLSIINRYLGMPSLEVIFPEVGRYEIKIVGTPRHDAKFKPFELVFKTNVGR